MMIRGEYSKLSGRVDSGTGSSSLPDEIENLVPPATKSNGGGCYVPRSPLNAIQDPSNLNGGPSEKASAKPPKRKMTDAATPSHLQQHAPDKSCSNYGFAAKNRFFGLGRKIEPVGGSDDDEAIRATKSSNDLLLVQSSRGAGGNGGFTMMTPPRSVSSRANNSAQNTPAKSVNKPPRVDGSIGGGRALVSTAGHSKGGPMPCYTSTVEVPHFDLKEVASSFWTENNVQVVIRIRPLSSMEKSSHGFNRCLKQESAQTVSWIGQPESRFTFDNVACETVDQEMLFRSAGLPMVENCLSGYNSCIFAYGQTGSGKTYTMLGEIDNLDVRMSSNRGMMPRIFEFLFARIQAEEELRRDERLQYICKCSFLEIYNEQIMDLLDPSSSNLLVREDMKKGVYVENLSEFEVQTVGDILKLLRQGSLNRKVASTNMNKESSRSHSVFTCVIESKWVKNSTSNLRFARLNLVDLAGSERQKTSGAEGERLKEATNINKSLSTLGHVIMLLLDVAQGKPKHIPYRDSRLTFLLQESLGGNSKTMIIANVSPSISCAAETLNTLKFAQRAKYIQNNAVVNEDSSGDVPTLQHRICLLKEELSILKRQNISRPLSFEKPIVEDISLMSEDEQYSDDLVGSEPRGIVRFSSKQFESVKSTLAGALRREQMAETSINQLEAEIEQLKRLVRQREEDTRCTKMTLRFREDKINRMESLLGGSIPADTYLLQENTSLTKEIELLQSKVDRNPEVTRFALENMRLLEQLRRFQEFYEDGEREILLAELSQLRDQLLKWFDGNSKQQSLQNFSVVSQEVHTTNERDSLQSELDETLGKLGDCRSKLSTCLEANEKLTREMHDLRSLMNGLTSAPVNQNNNFNTIKDSLESPAFATHLTKALQKDSMEEKHESRTNHMDEIVNLQLELDILKLIVKEEKSSRSEAEEKLRSLNEDLDHENKKARLMMKDCEDLKHELEDAKSIIEALESQQIMLINKMEDLENIYNRNEELLSEKELEIRVMKEQMLNQQLKDQSPLQAKLKRMQDSLETAKKLNMLYQTDHAYQTSNDEQMDEIGRQAEAETAEVIVCLQEELSTLEQEVQDSKMKEMENGKLVTCLQTQLKELEEQICVLTQKLSDKDSELSTVSQGWELLAGEIEELLVDGHEDILDAYDQLDLIADSFIEKRSWVSGQFGKMIRLISEKEQSIRELQNHLGDSNKRITEVESMLGSLKGAALAITEAHQQELTVKDKTISLLARELSEGKSIIENLDNKIARGEDQLRKVSACATAAFVTVNRLHETNLDKSDVIKHTDSLLSEATEMYQQKISRLYDQVTVVEEAERQIQLLRKELEVSAENCCSLRLMLAEEQKKNQLMVLTLSSCNTTKPLNSMECLDSLSTIILNKLTDVTIVDKLFQEFDGISEQAFKFSEELDLLEKIARDVSSENLSLQAELRRKDDITEGLLLDFSILQESAAISNNQKDEIKEMMASQEALENELLVKSNELDEAVSFGHTLEGQLKEKVGIISTLELELCQKRESVKSLSEENIELRTCIEDLSAAKTSVEDNLTKKIGAIDGLKQELLQLGHELSEGKSIIENLENKIASGEDQLRKLSACATAAFVIVNRLHETNCDKSDVAKHTYSLLCETTEQNQQNVSRLNDQVIVVEEAERQIQLLRKELEISAESCCSLRLMLAEEQKKNQLMVLTLSSYNTTKSLNSVESLDRLSTIISNKLADITIVDKLFQEFDGISEQAFKFSEELDLMGNIARDISSENLSLQAELRRKDDITEGLLLDLTFLQESAAINNNQKDEIKEMMASQEAIENELLVKSKELDEAVRFGHTLEGQLKDKEGILSTLVLELSQIRESVKSLSEENIELRTCIEDLSVAKTSVEDNLTEKISAIDGLEQELLHLGDAFDKMNASVDALKKNVNELTYDRDQLQTDVRHLKGKLDMAEADAEAHEAIAVEAQQIAESSKLYAAEKEEEVMLLEKSVEELENTVDVLENKVDIVREEAKRQRLQREELELELHALRSQLQNDRSRDDDMQRDLDEKEMEALEALKRVQILETDINDRDAEISKLKSHISELNLHAEAQACENKQKFKALEGMVEHVKRDGCSNHATNSSSSKLEKNASKPRGSVSPFKCIGMGLVQQMKSEKDEELTAAKIRIQELEALAIGRQKEIFMLNSRLASTESMTHDVLRDMLEVKLDMSKYASLLDNDEMHKIGNNAQVPCTESRAKEEEISRLKQQLSEFIEERAGWVEEMDHKHAELVTAQHASDKLRQQVQFLKAENETFKMENVDHRKKLTDLEGEMRKLSGQQNLQQRIHHHAKIKEENNQLRIQNENLINQLRRLDGTRSRVK